MLIAAQHGAAWEGVKPMTSTVSDRGFVAALLVLFATLVLTTLAVGTSTGDGPRASASGSSDADAQATGTVKWKP